MRKIFIAGNWKMNKDRDEVAQFCQGLASFASGFNDTVLKMIIAPAYPFLELASTLMAGLPVELAAQDVSLHEQGAYTGEVSAAMLESLELSYCIIGHSERRQYHSETDASIKSKQLILRKHGIKPILCIGESLAERDGGKTQEVLLNQLTGCFEGVELQTGQELLIAYEPVWAIGTGRTATPIQAEEAHQVIRGFFREKYSPEISQAIHILYGGSVKPDNIQELLSMPDIDGGLIGGAALDLASFIKMTETASKIIELRKI